MSPQVQPIGGCSDFSYPSEHAAVAGAAETVLAYLFPEQADRFQALVFQSDTAQLLAGTNYRSDIEAGLALGTRVGKEVIARGKADGSDHKSTGLIPQGTGYWVPTPPGYQAAPLEPLAGMWLPWNIASGSQFRPEAPPRPGSAQFEADLRAVYDISRPLSIDKQEIASFWEDKIGSVTPPGHWNLIALQLVRSKGLSTPQAALVFAALNTAQADAFIAAWDAKYTYWSVRPVTAIRRELDPSWSPYIYTPSFPSYVSGHATTSGAAAQVLSYFFPQNAASLQAWAEQAALSRLYGGIHFPTDNEVGLSVGRKVGSTAVTRIASIDWAQG
jgi:membrane-associated phospholipid phosphatase